MQHEPRLNRTHPSWITPFLVVAGIYNVLAALIMLAVAEQFFPLLFTKPVLVDTSILRFHVHALWLFVGIVGVTLLRGSRVPLENRGVMLVAALGKIGFVGLVILTWFEGVATGWFILATVGDILLAIGLVWAYQTVHSPK